MTVYKFDDDDLSETYGCVVYANADDITVLEVKPHAVQLASGDHRQEIDESFGHKVVAALNCHAELLAALKELLRMDTEGATGHDYKRQLEHAAAAIAKAEGR